MKIFVAIIVLTLPLAAQTPIWSESLESAQEKALEVSPELKAARAELEALQYAERASLVSFLPSLSFEGSYFYQTNVPVISTGSGASLSAGANNNYALGPVLRYTLFNGLRTINLNQSSKLLKDAKVENIKAIEREIRLVVKTLYFKAQLALGNLMTTSDALKIARAQSHDIELRYAAGASSKLDRYSARKDVTSYEIRIQQAQMEAASVLQELLVLTGQNAVYDVSAVPSTVQVHFDEQSVLLEKMQGMLELPAPVSEQPQVKAIALAGKASELGAKAQEGLLWPRIDLMAKGQLLYPNMVQPTQVWNNVLQASLVFPLWLGDSNWDLVKQKRREASAKHYQSEQKLRDLMRDYYKAVDAIKNLQKQNDLNLILIEQVAEISRMTYQAYLAGRVTFLEVQMANQRLLEVRMEQSKTIASLLIQFSNLEYLS